jgi:hypothetical protein
VLVGVGLGALLGTVRAGVHLPGQDHGTELANDVAHGFAGGGVRVVLMASRT